MADGRRPDKSAVDIGYSERLRKGLGQNQYGADADWVYIIATWRIRLNHLCAWAMQPYYGRPMLWPPYVIGHAIIFLPCGFYLSSSVYLFLPRLISAVADWMSAILPHMVRP